MQSDLTIRKFTWLGPVLIAGLLAAGCGARKNAAANAGNGTSAEPDKVLFERATDDMQHNRQTVARLQLQTLINTYPDSEYLAKAKLAIADSYYKEGGTTGLTQSIAEYQDFITFFPFLDEAAYAQAQVGMAHFRRMEKPDRDRTEALEAEGAFQTFLQKYPNNPKRGEVEQRLREVQEVIAEGDYRVANFYYIRQVNGAAAARLIELSNRYPLYSQADRVNWILGTLYEKSERGDIGAQYYSRIVKDYPLSKLVDDAKARLTKLGVPVPQPDPAALARMQAEQTVARPRNRVLSLPLGMLKSAPDVSMAARSGAPTLTPQGDDNTQTLFPGGTSRIGGAGGAPTGTGAFIETVTPGPAPSADGATPTAAPAAVPSTATSPTAAADPATAPVASPGGESSSKRKKSGIRKIIPF
jgi:outer membrane protein assembly factor BamD